MKTLALITTLLLSTTAVAGGNHHGYHGHHSGSVWVAPLIVGGMIGAVIASQPRNTYIQPREVYVQPSYNYRPMYRMVDVYVPECNCYQSVQVQIN